MSGSNILTKSALLPKAVFFKAFLCYFKAFLGKTSQKVLFFEEISGYTPEAVAKMLKLTQVGLSRHIANWK